METKINTLSISRRVGEMSTCRLQIVDTDGSLDPVLNAETDLDLSNEIELNLGYTSGGPALQSVFTGKVMDYTCRKLRSDDAKVIDVTVGSIFKNLANKKCLTELYTEISGVQLMNIIASRFGFIDSGLLDLSEDNDTIFKNILIEESNCFDALKKIAQACRVELFVSKQGKLTTKSFLNATTEVLTVDGSDIGDIQHSGSDINVSNYIEVVGKVKGEEYNEETVVYNSIHSVLPLFPTNTITIEFHFLKVPVKGITSVDIEFIFPDKTLFNYDEFLDVSYSIEEFTDQKMVLNIHRVDGNPFSKDELIAAYRADQEANLTTVIDYFLPDGSPAEASATYKFQVTVNGKITPYAQEHREFVLRDNYVPVGGFLIDVPYRARVNTEATDSERTICYFGLAKDIPLINKYGGMIKRAFRNEYIYSDATCTKVAEYLLKQELWSKRIFTAKTNHEPDIDLGDIIKFSYEDTWFIGQVREIDTTWDANDASMESSIVIWMIGRQT